MMGQFQDESFDPNAEPSQADLAMEEFMDTYEKGGEKALAAALRISEEELDQDINEWCAAHGKHADDDRDEAIEGVVQELVDDTNFDEGNAFAQKVRQAKANGKKKGDKVDGPDGDEITLEKDEKTPLGEFILSYFDRDNGSFPKGETAVLTMIEKDYGEEYITPAKQFIERINQTFEEYQMRVQPQQMENPEFDRIRELAGLR
jgi:succinate dehydrogenase flavin-adding protein (antitoxin of CptAB toxin-antitoxin module)